MRTEHGMPIEKMCSVRTGIPSSGSESTVAMGQPCNF